MKLSRLAPATILMCLLMLSACANTVRGAGQDIENTAEATEGAVEDIAN